MILKTLEKFDVPYFGRVELVHDSNDGSHGKYWLRNNVYGITGRFSKTPEEAKQKGLRELCDFAQEKRKAIVDDFNKITEAIITLIDKNSQKPNKPQIQPK